MASRPGSRPTYIHQQALVFCFQIVLKRVRPLEHDVFSISFFKDVFHFRRQLRLSRIHVEFNLLCRHCFHRRRDVATVLLSLRFLETRFCLELYFFISSCSLSVCSSRGSCSMTFCTIHLDLKSFVRVKKWKEIMTKMFRIPVLFNRRI